MTLKSYISNQVKSYFGRKSRWSIATDMIFIVLLVLMLIPASRKEIIIGVRKITMKQPQASIKSSTDLKEIDYNWAYQTSEGEVIDFKKLKNKVVFLNFWSTKCPHCIAELKSIENLYAEYNGKIEFILLTHENPSNVKRFLKKENYNIPFYLTYGYVPEVFNSPFIPATYIISKEGKIVINKTGPARWDGDEMKSFFNDLVNK